MKTVQVAMYSDYICPWCYIGKARLERVKEMLAGEIDVQIEVTPFLLYPDLPKGGAPKSVFAKKTKPGMGRSLRFEAEAEDIAINYKKIETIPNSLEAHRLTWLIPDQETKYELAKRLFHGYFEEGQNIEDHEYLSKIAREVGVSQEVIDVFASTNQGESEVASLITAAKEEFVSLVPSLKLAGKFMLPGLQPADVWVSYIRRAARVG